MILDEATSSIDTRTEAIVQRGMDQLMEGRTVFVIAHRLSTVKNSDVIMVLDHGRIIERGSHEKASSPKGAPTISSTPAHSSWNKGGTGRPPIFRFFARKALAFSRGYAIMTSTNVPSGSLPGRCFLTE